MAKDLPIFSDLYRGYEFAVTFVQHPNGITIEVDIDVDRYPTRTDDGLYGDYETAKKQGVKLAHRLIDQLFSG